MILDWAEYLSNWEISPGGTTLYVLYGDVPLDQDRARYRAPSTVLLLMVRSLGWPHTLPPRPQGNNTVRSFSSYFAVTFASSHPILQWKTDFMPGLTRLTTDKNEFQQNLPHGMYGRNYSSRRQCKIRYETGTTVKEYMTYMYCESFYSKNSVLKRTYREIFSQCLIYIFIVISPPFIHF